MVVPQPTLMNIFGPFMQDNLLQVAGYSAHVRYLLRTRGGNDLPNNMLSKLLVTSVQPTTQEYQSAVLSFSVSTVTCRQDTHGSHEAGIVHAIAGNYLKIAASCSLICQSTVSRCQLAVAHQCTVVLFSGFRRVFQGLGSHVCQLLLLHSAGKHRG